MARKEGQSFPWRKAIRNSLIKGAEAGAFAASPALAFPEPTVLATLAIAGSTVFFGVTVCGMAGEVLNYWTDDPTPMFDARTTILFDTVGMVLSFLIFVLPAFRLDLALNPHEPLPGFFGFLALFLSAFLVTIMRGLLINLGLVRGDDKSLGI